jgi:hypothetical protein
MNTLNQIILGAFLLSSALTNTFANSNSINNNLMQVQQNLPKVEPSNNIDNSASGIVSKIISNLISNSDLIPEPLNESFVRIPNSFEPNVEYGHLLDVEVFEFSKIDVKIYNNWGVQVAESSLKNKKSKQKTNSLTLNKLKLSKQKNDQKLNKDLKEGTYFYVVDIYSHDGEKVTKEGEIRLLRTQRK